MKFSMQRKTNISLESFSISKDIELVYVEYAIEVNLVYGGFTEI